MSGENEKSWTWNREPEDAKRVAVEGYGEVMVRQPTRVSAVNTRVRWGRAVKNLQLELSIDGGESDISLFFGIPWLFGIYITLDCVYSWFARKYPTLNKAGASSTTGFCIGPELVSFSWRHYDDGQWIGGRETPGKRYLQSWDKIFKGEMGKCHTEPAKLVYERSVPLEIRVATREEPHVPKVVLTHFKVYAVHYTRHYRHWWPQKDVRYEVSHDQRIWVRDHKGAEWQLESPWDAELQSAWFSSGKAKSAKEALELYLVEFNRYQNPNPAED